MLRHVSLGARRLLVVVAFSFPGTVAGMLTATGASEVSFTARGTAGLRIVGTTHDLAVADDGTRLTVRVPVRNLVTGIALRDRHLKEQLDAAHHRVIELQVTRDQLRFPTSGSVQASARGMMLLRGKSHAVPFRYTAEREGRSIHVNGTARIDMTWFGIEPPRYLGLRVEPGVDVRAQFSVEDR